MPYQSFPFNAPRTWREFLARVAAIALAALIVLGVLQLTGLLSGTHSPRPALAPHQTPDAQQPIDVPAHP